MKHYRIAIVAPVEYRSDDPTWRCFEALRLAGHAVELLDPRRFPAIIGEDGNIDPSIAARFLERFRPDCITYGDETAEEILARLDSERIGSEIAPRRFVIFGYVGPNNFGDELIFSLICQEIERRFPNAHIQLIGHDPQATLQRHGVVSTTCERKLDIDIMLRGASALIYMAGIMFDDAFEAWSAGPVDLFLNPRSEIGGQAAFTLMASLYRVPTIYLGIGAGPLANPDAQRLVRLEARNGARYFPRDGETVSLLLDAGVPSEQIEQVADLSFALEGDFTGTAAPTLEALDLQAGSYIAVSLRDHRTVPDGFEQTAARALEAIARQHHQAILFLALAPEDESISRRVMSLLPASCKATLFDPGTDEQLAVSLLASARAVIAMRLHCSIVANACGVPGLGLNYNEKIEAFYNLMDRTDYLLSMDASSAEIVDAFSRMCEHGDEDRYRIAAHTDRNRKQAKHAFDAMQDIVQSASPIPLEPRILYPRTVSFEEQYWREAERNLLQTYAERDDALRELEALRRELERTKASTTWKVGSALTSLPRALKRVRDGRKRP